uniref:ATPase AAA-type core domain-containing protein n=1 Tax=viral metagenome TaxID=1070528 RepID=A0A6C0JFZ2_9ZZZZ
MPGRYNLRKRGAQSTTWVKDETLKQPDSESEDEEYVPPSDSEEEETAETEDEEEEESEEEEMDSSSLRIPKGAKVSVKLHIHTIAGGKGGRIDVEEESEEESDEESEEEDFIGHLMNKYVHPERCSRLKPASRKRKEREEEAPAMELNEDEEEYYEDLSKSKRRHLNEKMKKLSTLVVDGDVPFKFRVLDMDVSDNIKASVIKKIDNLFEMSMEGEGYKLRAWVESFLRIPFGKCVPLPVTIADGPEKCSAFLEESTKTLDTAVYGMVSAKTQIMQILAQWMSNPSSVGNVIALKGPMGVGKTSFARNGVAKVLQRPFEFFSLGGASDASNFVGHSYTYEGSTWGRIADAVMSARCMNPVLYFDEVDKISTTAHGDEIASMLIHLTDRSQNSQFHDRYFAGVDFDLSQCLFVFSFNDESKIHPVLKDRMQVITCSGYSWEEKASIVRQYIWPQILDRIQLKDQLTISEEAIKYLISEFSKEEEGVRNLIRIVETLVTRVNLLRIAGETTAKKYVFYTPIKLPLLITPDLCRRILEDTLRSGNESFRHMYT